MEGLDELRSIARKYANGTLAGAGIDADTERRILQILANNPQLAKKPSMFVAPSNTALCSSDWDYYWDKKVLATPLFFLVMAGAKLCTIRPVFDLFPGAISKSFLRDDDAGPTLLFVACGYGVPHNVIQFLASKYPEAASRDLVKNGVKLLPIHVGMARQGWGYSEFGPLGTFGKQLGLPPFPFRIAYRSEPCTKETVKLLVQQNPGCVNTTVAVSKWACDIQFFGEETWSFHEFAVYNYIEKDVEWMLENIPELAFAAPLRVFQILHPIHYKYDNPRLRSLRLIATRARSLCFSTPRQLKFYRSLWLWIGGLGIGEPEMRSNLESLSIQWPGGRLTESDLQRTRLVMQKVKEGKSITTLKLCGTADLPIADHNHDQILAALVTEIHRFGKPFLCKCRFVLCDFKVSWYTYQSLLYSGIRNLEMNRVTTTSSMEFPVNLTTDQTPGFLEFYPGKGKAHDPVDMTSRCSLKTLSLSNARESWQYQHFPGLLFDIPKMHCLKELTIENFVGGGIEKFFTPIIRDTKCLVKFTLGYVGRNVGLGKVAEGLFHNNTLKEFRISARSVRKIEGLNCLIEPLREKNTKLSLVSRLQMNLTDELPNVGEPLWYLTNLNKFGREEARCHTTSLERFMELLVNVKTQDSDYLNRGEGRLGILYGLLLQNPSCWSQHVVAPKLRPNKKRNLTTRPSPLSKRLCGPVV